MLNAHSEAQIRQHLIDHWEEVVDVPDLRLESVKSEPPPSEDWRPDLLLKANWRGKSVELIVEVKAARYMADIPQARNVLNHAGEAYPGAVQLLVAPYLSEEQQRRCRDLGLNFLDLSGNAWIDAGDFLLDRRGRPNKYKKPRQAKSAFSDKASLVVRGLLGDRGRPMGIRDIAERVGVSPGWASQVIARLREMGYAVSGSDGIELINGEDLLLEWAADYSFRKNEISSWYLPFRDLREGMKEIEKRIGRSDDLPDYALSLHAGAWLVAPHAEVPQIHAYVFGPVPGEPVEEEIEKLAVALDLRRVAERGNVHLMSPYYAHGVRYGLRSVKGLSVVSDIQLFLDLHSYPTRGREQADHLLDVVLRDKLP